MLRNLSDLGSVRSLHEEYTNQQPFLFYIGTVHSHPEETTRYIYVFPLEPLPRKSRIELHVYTQEYIFEVQGPSA
jgi:hypothetical protein